MHTSQGGLHCRGAYPGFCNMKQLRALLLLPGWNASPSQDYPQFYVAGYPFYTPGWGETMQDKVSCLRKQHDGRDWASSHRPSDLISKPVNSVLFGVFLFFSLTFLFTGHSFALFNITTWKLAVLAWGHQILSGVFLVK